MSQENNPTETDLAIAAINNSISVIQSLAARTTNIVYDPTLNKTKVYGHTNFEELNVLGNAVALQSQIPDISGKADSNHNHDSTYAAINHTHDIDDVVNLQTSLDGKLNTNMLTTQTGLDNLHNTFWAMPDGGIKMINNYPSGFWQSVIFRCTSGRGFMLAVSKIGNDHNIRVYYSHSIFCLLQY